jgi:hypothetical protein
MSTNKVTVVIGDVHGCIQEFDSILNILDKMTGDKRIIVVGDLMDRGPEPVACVHRTRELGLECILGNHEEKHIRLRNQLNQSKTSAIQNPVKPMARLDRLAHESLSDSDIAWMKSLKLTLQIHNKLWVVHGGCEPRRAFDNQRPNQVLRVRYVGTDGLSVKLNPDKTQPANTRHWAEYWRGPESIVYGHCVHDLNQVKLDKFPNGYCLGIDTGCCFGGNLTAAIFVDDKFDHTISVPAKKEYYVRYTTDD